MAEPLVTRRAGTTDDTFAAPSAGVRRQLLSPEQLSEYLQIPLQTVYKWRSHGNGPRGFRVGKHVRYDIDDVNVWLTTRQAD